MSGRSNGREPRVRVAFLAGTGRSGSTLLARMLGAVDGCFAAGEVRYLFERGLVQGRTCSCGEPLDRCPVWHAVLEQAYGSVAAAPTARAVSLIAATTRVRRIGPLLGEQLRAGAAPAVVELREILAPLYAAIAAVTGAAVVVDSSKLPSYLGVLAGMESIDLRVVQLVRDPRAAAYSWQRTKVLTDGGTRTTMETISPPKSAVLWLGWNAVAELIGSRARGGFVRCRYEDLVRDPRSELRRILTAVGSPDADLSFVTENGVELGAGHVVAGNPDRMRTGPTRLRLDDEWRAALPRAARLTVGVPTAPLRWRYGYRGA